MADAGKRIGSRLAVRLHSLGVVTSNNGTASCCALFFTYPVMPLTVYHCSEGAAAAPRYTRAMYLMTTTFLDSKAKI